MLIRNMLTDEQHELRIETQGRDITREFFEDVRFETNEFEDGNDGHGDLVYRAVEGFDFEEALDQMFDLKYGCGRYWTEEGVNPDDVDLWYDGDYAEINC